MNSYFLYLREVKENIYIFSFKCALVLSGEQIAHRVRRKYSLGSSLDLVRTQLILINSNMITQKTNKKASKCRTYTWSLSRPTGEAKKGSVSSKRFAPPTTCR